MATKKQPPKSAGKNGAKASKAAKPAPKAVAKKAPPKKAPVKSASKPAAKVVKKAAPPAKKPLKPAPKVAPKKAVPVKTTAPKKAPVAKKEIAPVAKKEATPLKKAPVAPVKVSAPLKPVVPAKSVAKAPAKTVVVAPIKTAPVKIGQAPKLPPKPGDKKSMAAPPAQPVKSTVVPPPFKKKEIKKEPARPTKIVIPKTSTTKAVKYEPDFTKSVLDSQQKAHTGPTMRYSDSELQEFRDLIGKKLETAKKELAYLQGLITRKDEGGDMEDGRYMTMEDGSMSMEREQLSQMASRQIQFIDHLEKALMRIENKTYGVCRVTGKLIDKARLRAVPHATLSIEAKQMMNK
jgi:RNA polymerase-binding transcription factor DksA